MGDLISKQAVIDALDKEYRCTDRSDDWDGLETAMLIIENLPSAQPQTTGMICGSCKYSDGTALYTTAKVRCQRSGDLHFVTDYCNLPPAQPEKRTETHACDSINGQGAIDTEGLDVQIRCEMCRNPMHTDRGCDGNCKYDEKLYERIMQILGERIKPLSSAQLEQPEISYKHCADAMLKMWIDNVLTDGEYNRIMDKLNAHWAERREE